MLKVEGASFSYSAKDRLLFEHLAFEVNAGQTLAILGPNGVGKTTLLRCIMRFLKLNNGRIEIDGTESAELDNRTFWKKISYVPQAKRLVFGYSALNMVVMGLSQNVGFGASPKKEDYEKAYQLLERFHIADLASQSCNTLSGGQLQMVLIARALIKEPQLLIMDEPESNLDMKNQLIVLDTIESLTEDQLSIIINTHYPDHALRCAQKTLIMGGKNYLFGDTESIVTEDHIREFFEINAEIVERNHTHRLIRGILPVDIVQA